MMPQNKVYAIEQYCDPEDDCTLSANESNELEQKDHRFFWSIFVIIYTFVVISILSRENETEKALKKFTNVIEECKSKAKQYEKNIDELKDKLKDPKYASEYENLKESLEENKLLLSRVKYSISSAELRRYVLKYYQVCKA